MIKLCSQKKEFDRKRNLCKVQEKVRVKSFTSGNIAVTLCQNFITLGVLEKTRHAESSEWRASETEGLRLMLCAFRGAGKAQLGFLVVFPEEKKMQSSLRNSVQESCRKQTTHEASCVGDRGICLKLSQK